MDDPAQDFYMSVPATVHLLNMLRLHAPRCCVIYLSSAAVYGNPETLPISEEFKSAPISPYGFHKLMCEHLCTEFFSIYGLRTIVVRIFSAYGAGLKRQVLWDICRMALKETSVTLKGTGNESRDFISVLDISRALSLLAESATFEGDTFNLASGNETTIRTVAGLLVKGLGLDAPVEFDGIVKPGDPVHWRADIQRITQLAFVPTINLEEGVLAYARWCKDEIAQDA
jgi:UDP-glucose 4-epimerase